MRVLITVVGTGVIVAYAIVGALLMNRWEIAAASRIPFDEAVAGMEAAGQPYNPAPGVIFAVAGVILAAGWAYARRATERRASQRWSLGAWGAIVALGAPAYFAASFSNMNSVGDTFYDWDAAAAFAVVSPLYALSAIGAVIAVVGVVVAMRTRTPIDS